jgi:hypothetical protein
MTIKAVGIDLAKNVFQLHGIDELSEVVRRRVQRAQLLETVAQLQPCVIGIEASSSAYYWAEQFERLGHTVRIISPHYVNPFRRNQKNDGNDAAAICTADFYCVTHAEPPWPKSHLRAPPISKIRTQAPRRTENRPRASTSRRRITIPDQ